MSYILFLLCTIILHTGNFPNSKSYYFKKLLQYISLNLSFDFCSKIMATVIRPLGITTFYTLILNLLYTNHIILHVPTYYHHNSNHVSEIPRRPLILFIGVCHKLYFCGIELSSINLWIFCAGNFGEEEYCPSGISHGHWPLAMLRSKMGDCAKNRVIFCKNISTMSSHKRPVLQKWCCPVAIIRSHKDPAQKIVCFSALKR